MKRFDLKHYSCPACKGGEFDVVPADEKAFANTGTIDMGELRCGTCRETYFIGNGIPRFLKKDNYAGSFGVQWNLNRRTQLDSFTELTISRDRLFNVSRWPQRMEGEYILEAGSGAGRFTEVLLDTGAEVFSFDLSSAVEANYINNGQHANLHLFQGDIYRIPLLRASFDKVLCLGVLQHTPDPKKAFQNLVEYVRPGGEIVIDVYKKTIFSRLQWKYVLRPLTKRLDGDRLYGIISRWTRKLWSTTVFLDRCLGGFGRRLMPIRAYAFDELTNELNLEWSILDTFDMYAPAHDHPQTIATVRRWFEDAGLQKYSVEYGLNGIVGRGYRV